MSLWRRGMRAASGWSLPAAGATVAGWEREEPYKALVEGRYGDAPERWPLIRHDAAVRPLGVYAATKVWGEAICRQVADSSPLSVLCLRIGYVNAKDRPHPSTPLCGVVRSARHRRSHRTLRGRAARPPLRCSVRELPQPMGIPGPVPHGGRLRLCPPPRPPKTTADCRSKGR